MTFSALALSMVDSLFSINHSFNIFGNYQIVGGNFWFKTFDAKGFFSCLVQVGHGRRIRARGLRGRACHDAGVPGGPVFRAGGPALRQRDTASANSLWTPYPKNRATLVGGLQRSPADFRGPQRPAHSFLSSLAP